MGIRPRFDADREYVCAREFHYDGVDYEEGQPFSKEGADIRRVAAMYEARALNMVELEEADEEDTKGVTYEATGGGWYLINAAWLEEPLKSKGKTATEALVENMREEGEPASHHGFTLTAGDNGWWVITSDKSDVELKVHGEQAARDNVATLRAGGIIEGSPFNLPDPVTVAAGEGEDEFVITVEGSDETEIVVGEEAANARADEIRASLKAPPEGETEQ
jgi:hypothetical protein